MSHVQFLTSTTYYWDHLQPIAAALPDGIDWVHHTKPDQLLPGVPVVVSSYGDLKEANRRNLPSIMTEHGCGLSYNTAHPSYAGGPNREGVVLFLNTNHYVDDANRRAYPNARHVIIGSPKLDALVASAGNVDRPADPVVAFSWHWHCTVVPETGTAFQYYRPGLNALARTRPFPVLGHAHPRAWSFTRPVYRKWGWPIAQTFEEVVAGAWLYVADNTSTIYEWAALGRPVVVLNHPRYRRGMTQGGGLRFWDNIPGPQVNDNRQLAPTILAMLTNDTWAEERQRITNVVYPHLGESAPRAAAAIAEVVG